MHYRSRHAIQDIFHAGGLRVTPGRIALFDLLRSSAIPVGTPELAKRLVPRQMDLVTLYRTLSTLEEKGLIRTARIDQRHASYELRDESGHHHHLVCRSCHKIEDVAECDLVSVEKMLLAHSKKFHQITSHALEFFGLCNRCAKKG